MGYQHSFKQKQQKKKTKKKKKIEKTRLFPLLMYKSARGQKWVDKDEKETESYSFFFFRDFYLTNKKKCRRFLCVFGARLLPPPSIRIASVAGLTVAAVLTEISREKARVQNVSFGGSPRELS